MFRRIRSKLGEKVSNTTLVKDFYEKEGERIDWAKKEYAEFRGDLREQVDASHNPLIRGSAMAYDKARADTPMARAIMEMKKYDPHFDFNGLHYEVEEVFREFYCNYLDGNKEYVQKVTGGEATVMQAMIQMREEQGWAYKYPEVLDCSEP